MKIYQSKIEDWQKVKEIRLRALENEPQAFNSSFERESSFSAQKWQELTEENVILLAEDQGEIIGITCMKIDKNVATIWGVYIKQEYRGKGIGKELLEKIIQDSKQFRLTKAKLAVRCNQVAAQALYKKLGFTVVQTFKKQIQTEDNFIDREIMELAI